MLLILKLIKHKDNFQDFFSTEQDLIKRIYNIKTLREDVKELKETGKGISFYSFRKTFRTMLGLKNDLSEYFMGHRLGDSSKETYININSMDNNLFVDEYAEPVISMLDKYVFYSDEELKKMDEKDKKKLMDRADYFQRQIEQGVPLKDVFMDYEIKEYREVKKNDTADSLKKNEYFERI